MVHPISRRNRNFLVQVGGSHYFLKQAGKWKRAERDSLETEAGFYRQTRSDTALAFLQEYVPECHAYDPASSVLVMEYLLAFKAVPDASTRFDSLIGERMGDFLARLHNATASPLETQGSSPSNVPWFFSLHTADDDALEESSGGRRDLLRTVRRHRGFGNALDRLRKTWRPQCLIHADFKLENVLINQAGNLRVIDWEYICRGDPAWDAATLLQSFWNFHVQWPNRNAVESIRPALRAFTQVYGLRTSMTPQDFTSRVIPFAGVRMLQSAFETLEKAEGLTPRAIRLLQAAMNIMSTPEWAADYFLGADWQTLLLN